MYHLPYPIEMYDPRMRERYNDPMYAQGNGGYNSTNTSGGNNAQGGGTRGYREGMMPMDYGSNRNYSDMRDPREGRSGERRKMYMEGKGMKDKTHQMKELEAYMQELTQDMTEMISDATPEEKQMLQQKISTLATKIK